ncbi:MAG: carboxypeptidase regulatory-like domain-containing protein, partial [Acidobacteriaceae bacterium]|nr:carboxypeptidase regulatory-like domain-containing protein [Acidobacteriaceae bacterium]
MQYRTSISILLITAAVVAPLRATIFSTVGGVVHDPNHRPISGAQVLLRAMDSDYRQDVSTADDGSFEFPSVALGQYTIDVTRQGFAPQQQFLNILSNTVPVLHFQLQLAGH